MDFEKNFFAGIFLGLEDSPNKTERKKEMKKKLITLLLAAAMVVSLAACGNSDAGNTAPDSSSPSGTATDDKTPEAETPSGTGSASLEVLNVGIEADCTNFNPWGFSGTGANLVIYSLYQPFVYAKDGVYYPGICKDWEISEDGLIFTGYMFENISDWAGNHITADDVLFSWYNGACAFYPENLDKVKECKKIDEYTVSFEFYDTINLDDMCNTVSRLYIVSQAAYEASDNQFSTDPIGTGRYKLTDYTSGYKITYEKVENWWNEDYEDLYSADYANVDTINWFIITESTQRTLALEQGTIDMCSSISSDDLGEFDNANGYKLFSYDENLSLSLFPNCNEGNICDDVNLRLAIFYAVDNNEILDKVYDGHGTAMYDHAPAWSVGYNTAWESEDNFYTADEGKAAEYLAKSNYDGETIRILTLSTATCQNAAVVIQNELNKLGIKSEISSYDSGTISNYYSDPSGWDLLLYTRPCTIYTVNAIYTTQSQERYKWGGSLNYIFDDEYEALLKTCYGATTTSQENIDKLHEYMVENAYVKGIVNGQASCVIPDNVANVELSWRKSIVPGACIFE